MAQEPADIQTVTLPLFIFQQMSAENLCTISQGIQQDGQYSQSSGRSYCHSFDRQCHSLRDSLTVLEALASETKFSVNKNGVWPGLNFVVPNTSNLRMAVDSTRYQSLKQTEGQMQLQQTVLILVNSLEARRKLELFMAST